VIPGNGRLLSGISRSVGALPALLLLPLAAVAAIPPMPEGFQALNSLDYERALRIFEQETQQRPDDPEAWNHLAQALLHRALFQAGALDSAAFGPGSPFLNRPRVPMSGADQARFDEAIRRSLSLCEARLRANPLDGACLYASGVAHAHQAQMALLVKKSWREALREGGKSRHAHEALIKVSPDFADAFLIPGLHEYIAGSLPWYVKALAFLAGYRGDRAEGIRHMERAVSGGRKTAVEARVLLGVVLRREKQYARAAQLMSELAAAFPANHLYRSEEILLLAEAGQEQSARQRLAELESSRLLPPEKFEALSRIMEEAAARSRRRR
jgi:tetratricopeptide (TPR) repeat protein